MIVNGAFLRIVVIAGRRPALLAFRKGYHDRIACGFIQVEVNFGEIS